MLLPGAEGPLVSREQQFLVRQDEIRRRLYFLVTKSELVYIEPS